MSTFFSCVARTLVDLDVLLKDGDQQHDENAQKESYVVHQEQRFVRLRLVHHLRKLKWILNALIILNLLKCFTRVRNYIRYNIIGLGLLRLYCTACIA